jgi:DNA-binding Xre family transcriptional regulator
VTTAHFKLDDILRRHKVSALALAKASGLAKTTVYNIVNNKAKAVELGTLGRLLAGLEQLTGENMTFDDLLEKDSTFDWRREVLKNARPLGAEALKALIPDWLPVEKEHNWRVWQEIEAEKRAAAKRGSRRLREIEQLFRPEDRE